MNGLGPFRSDELTLRGFLIAWCGTGRVLPQSLPAFVSEGHDPAHPIVHDSPLAESDIVLGFLRQRAWLDAEAELQRQTGIDRDGVMALRERGMSFDAIAAMHGCSHDTVAKLVANVTAPRKRARLVGYGARSRLRNPQPTSDRPDTIPKVSGLDWPQRGESPPRESES